MNLCKFCCKNPLVHTLRKTTPYHFYMCDIADRSRSSWYRISRLLAGWLGGPRSSGHTNGTRWKNPPRPDGLSHGSHLPRWGAGNRLHRSKRSTNYTRGAGKNSGVFFSFGFELFWKELQKKAPGSKFWWIFMSFWVWKSIRFYRWSSRAFP